MNKHTVYVLPLVFNVALLAADGASAGVQLWQNGFEETETNNWAPTGNAGIDRGRGFAHSGNNNGWVGWATGWNALSSWVQTFQNATCTAIAYIRTSDTLTDGYMSVRSASQNLPLLNQIKIHGGNSGYTQYSVQFTADGSVGLFYFGVYGTGTDWVKIGGMQVDDVTVACPTPF